MDNNSIKTDYAMSYQNIEEKLNQNGQSNVTGRRKSRFHKWLDVVLDMKGVKGLGEGKNNPNDSLESYELGQKSALREAVRRAGIRKFISKHHLQKTIKSLPSEKQDLISSFSNTLFSLISFKNS